MRVVWRGFNEGAIKWVVRRGFAATVTAVVVPLRGYVARDVVLAPTIRADVFQAVVRVDPLAAGNASDVFRAAIAQDAFALEVQDG